VLTHRLFSDIALHDDDELAAILGAPIERRKTVHEWPLSCVQGLRLADGRRMVYKSQLPPTVEPQFYDRASSPLLAGHRSLGRLGACETMTIDWISAPRLDKVAHGEDELVAHGRRIVAQIGEIAGDLPTYLDVGSVEAWSAVAQGVLEKMTKLIGDGRFTLTDLATVDRVRAFTRSDAVLAAVTAGPRVAHGDLKADQVFVTADGYRLIDWQRPVLAPPDIDLVTLLDGEGIDPRKYVDPTVVAVFWFLHLHWAVEAQFDLFPDRRWPLFDQWGHEATDHILAST
jgi:hypothetical protein